MMFIIVKIKGVKENKTSYNFSFVWFSSAFLFAFFRHTKSTIEKTKRIAVTIKNNGNKTISPSADKSPTNFSLNVS